MIKDIFKDWEKAKKLFNENRELWKNVGGIADLKHQPSPIKIKPQAPKPRKSFVRKSNSATRTFKKLTLPLRRVVYFNVIKFPPYVVLLTTFISTLIGLFCGETITGLLIGLVLSILLLIIANLGEPSE